MDRSELAAAQAEYGTAMGELSRLREELRHAPASDVHLRQRVGAAEDRVTRAAARLALLKSQR